MMTRGVDDGGERDDGQPPYSGLAVALQYEIRPSSIRMDGIIRVSFYFLMQVIESD